MDHFLFFRFTITVSSETEGKRRFLLHYMDKHLPARHFTCNISGCTFITNSETEINTHLKQDPRIHYMKVIDSSPTYKTPTTLPSLKKMLPIV